MNRPNVAITAALLASACAQSGQGWYAATDTAAHRSVDDGDTWSRVL